jgi:hypothetical protein
MYFFFSVFLLLNQTIFGVEREKLIHFGPLAVAAAHFTRTREKTFDRIKKYIQDDKTEAAGVLAKILENDQELIYQEFQKWCFDKLNCSREMKRDYTDYTDQLPDQILTLLKQEGQNRMKNDHVISQLSGILTDDEIQSCVGKYPSFIMNQVNDLFESMKSNREIQFALCNFDQARSYLEELRLNPEKQESIQNSNQNYLRYTQQQYINPSILNNQPDNQDDQYKNRNNQQIQHKSYVGSLNQNNQNQRKKLAEMLNQTNPQNLSESQVITKR